MGLERSTCGVGIIGNQGKQSLRFYKRITYVFHGLSKAGVSKCFSVKGQIVNVLGLAYDTVCRGYSATPLQLNSEAAIDEV